MWFDVKAALAEIEPEHGAEPAARTPRPGSRVAHVARVARRTGPESGNSAGNPRAPGGFPRALDDLTPDERDQYEERAAILEYDGGFPRPEAERRALAEVLQLDQYRARRGLRE